MEVFGTLPYSGHLPCQAVLCCLICWFHLIQPVAKQPDAAMLPVTLCIHTACQFFVARLKRDWFFDIYIYIYAIDNPVLMEFKLAHSTQYGNYSRNSVDCMAEKRHTPRPVCHLISMS